MSGLVLVCSLLGRLGPMLRSVAGPSSPLGALGTLGPLVPLSMLAAAAEAGGRAGTLVGPRVPGPRMDYDEWTPLGRGDPLKNDPTFDYVPPVLERVHYWMEAKEGAARRDEAFDGTVPVPPTMLVPPPPPPPAPAPGVVTGLTSGPTSSLASSLASGLASSLALTPAPPAAVTYSSLNPFHHFEDRPVVPNILFEEKPVFEVLPPASLAAVSLPLRAPQAVPQAAPPPPPALPQQGPILDKSREPPPPLAASSNMVAAKQQPMQPPALKAAAHRPQGPTGPQSPPITNKHVGGPNAIQGPPHKPASSKLSFPGPSRVGPKPKPPQAPTAAPPSSTPPPTTTVPTPTSASLPTPPTPDTISSLVRGLLQRDTSTTMTTLTTDPLFAHYRQPATPVHGPAYLIIQGHSKVKTYGPVLRAYDPSHSNKGPKGPKAPKGSPSRRHTERAP